MLTLPLWLSAILPLFLANLIGMIYNNGICTWYQSLNKPRFTPPDWIFPLAWSAWYLMMGTAYYVAQEEYLKLTNPYLINFGQWGLIFYWVQLFVNLSWSPVFFYLAMPIRALYIILLMDITVIITSVLFFQTSSAAGALLIPYILWIVFTTYVNYELIRLNEVRDGKFVLASETQPLINNA